MKRPWDAYSQDQKNQWLDKMSEGLDSQQNSFLRLLHTDQENKESPRKNKPHVAIVDFQITMQQIDTDGNLTNTIHNANDLRKLGMNDTGKLIIKGGNFCEVAKKVDKVLRLINEQK
jgi:hypothetical protein